MVKLVHTGSGALRCVAVPYGAVRCRHRNARSRNRCERTLRVRVVSTDKVSVSCVCHPLISLIYLSTLYAPTSQFYPRDAMLARVYATAFPSVCLCVCVSHVCFVLKRLNISSKFFLPPDSPNILVFRHRGSLLNSDGFTTNRAPNTRG